MNNAYSEYPSEVKINSFYLLRRRFDLHLRVIKILAEIGEGQYLGVLEFKSEIKVVKTELIILDPDRELFKHLMRLPLYRNDCRIRKALVKMGYEADKYMVKPKDPINSFDGDISKEEFERHYEKYLEKDKKYTEDSFKDISMLIVPGTREMNAYSLYKIVSKNGGMEKVTNDQKWKLLFYPSMKKTNVSYTVRTFYKKYLYEFECFRRFTDDKHEIFNYKYKLGECVSLSSTTGEIYCGIVKLRRNRGLNQYYIQFLEWPKEHNEWYSEDVLEICLDPLRLMNNNKRPSRSSKANNLIDDPLIREKHSHSNKSTERLNSNDSISSFSRMEPIYGYWSSMNNISNSRPFNNRIDSNKCLEFLSEVCSTSLNLANNFKKIECITFNQEISDSPSYKEVNSSSTSINFNICEEANNENFLQELTGRNLNEPDLNEENYFFVSFFK